MGIITELLGDDQRTLEQIQRGVTDHHPTFFGTVKSFVDQGRDGDDAKKREQQAKTGSAILKGKLGVHTNSILVASQIK